MRHSCLLLSAVVTILATFISGPVGADELPVAYSETSTYKINYDDWNLILSSTVLDVGRSDRRPASRNTTRSITTRIKHGNTSKTAAEGNRVLFHEFKGDNRESLLAIRRDLEAIPNFVSLEKFTKNEQLAYWLNLHNVAVILEVTKAYPLKKVKSLRVGRESVWDKKTMSIGGVPISIADIEEHVVRNWNTPLVLYGFFMGAIGGPNIRTEAYTGENVAALLQENAIEFVNSLRGFKRWSGKGRVSDHYKLGAHFFPNFDEDIKKHMLSYAVDQTYNDLAKTTSFRAKNYDWGIADLKNGDTYNGSSFNTSSGALWSFIQTPVGGALVSVPGLSTLGTDPTVTSAGLQGISPQAKALLRAMKIRNERRKRSEQVTVEEYVDSDGGRVSKKNY